ncbi:hypothetical protein LAZ67_4002086 [Cordylochernes scorpioides]|uniref:Transposable element Tcb2 transposase n=1 Tax=Cordylochernes scorpioides TaxID=51811 RepID=A0ABY6KDA0_9ARAC|nr:hypothetical protein LAZ67_4002086 [Cordylochernes scorpioides]
MSKSRIKTMIIVFFDIRGIVHCYATNDKELVKTVKHLFSSHSSFHSHNYKLVTFQRLPDTDLPDRTISRRLVANGLHSCRPLRRLPLTPPNRRQRLEWCRARTTWMTEWHRVVFSDESRFCLSSDSRRVRVWRRRGERSNPAAIVERPTVRQRGIMVWGAIAYDSRSPLLRIQGTMTAQQYLDDVLRPVTLPYLQGVPNALYQQDNARPHTARISQQALQDVQMLPWPPYSPDLSPIEHVWGIIGRRLHALPQPRSEDQLWQMIVLSALVAAASAHLGLLGGYGGLGWGHGGYGHGSGYRIHVGGLNYGHGGYGKGGYGGYGGYGLGGYGGYGLLGGHGLLGLGGGLGWVNRGYGGHGGYGWGNGGYGGHGGYGWGNGGYGGHGGYGGYGGYGGHGGYGGYGGYGGHAVGRAWSYGSKISHPVVVRTVSLGHGYGHGYGHGWGLGGSLGWGLGGWGLGHH